MIALLLVPDRVLFLTLSTIKLSVGKSTLTDSLVAAAGIIAIEQVKFVSLSVFFSLLSVLVNFFVV